MPGLLLEELDSGPRWLQVWALSHPSALGRTANRPPEASLTSWTRRRGWRTPAGRTHPVNTRHSRVQNRMSTWLNMADCVRRMARWKSFCGMPAGQGHSLGPALQLEPFPPGVPGLGSERGGVSAAWAPLRDTCPRPSALGGPSGHPQWGAAGGTDRKGLASVRMGVNPGGDGCPGGSPCPAAG